MNIALAARRPTRRRRYRWRLVLFETASVALAIALVIWSLMPVYNMMLIALDPEGENEFDGKLWPPEPSLDSFRVVWTQGHWYLENIWHQFGNSLYIGLLTMLLTLLISSLASFAVGRIEIVRALILSLTGFLATTHDGIALPTPVTQPDRGAGQQPYQERVNVSRILVDTRVIDAAGRPIKGLAVRDFEVTINGKPAAVDSIEWVPSQGGDGVLPASPTLPITPPSPRGRTIVFFYEKKPDLSEVVGLMRVQRDLAAFENIVAPDDRVAVVSFDTHLRLWVDFTNDVARIRRVLEHDIVVSSPARVELGAFPSLRASLTPEVERSSDTIEKGFRALGNALEALPGTKSIIVLGYAMGTWAPRVGAVYMASDYAEAFAALQKARVSVFCVDLTRADYHPRQEGLRMIADDTGGFYMQSHIFSAAIFDRLAGALAGYYALLVVPPEAQRGERHIDVRLVHRKGKVFAKRRYVDE
jgi:VWFA-related protein